MQRNEILQKRIVADFLQTSRHHLGLPDVIAASSRTPLGGLRPMLRSLLVAGSLGTVLNPPAFASETMCTPAGGDIPKSAAKRTNSSPAAPFLSACTIRSSQN